MKNDIIGSFGIIILAIVLVIIASRADNLDNIWWGNVEIGFDANSSNNSNNENNPATMNDFMSSASVEVKGSSVVTEYAENGEDCKTSCKIDWKQMPPIPYLAEELQKKYNKKYIVETRIGEYFLWPQKKNKFSNITNADAVIIESIHDPTGKTISDHRSQISKILKKLSFKQVKNSNCLIPGNHDFADCLDYYERGDYKCASMVIYEPIDKTEVEKVEAKVIQTKVVCGMIKAQ